MLLRELLCLVKLLWMVLGCAGWSLFCPVEPCVPEKTWPYVEDAEMGLSSPPPEQIFQPTTCQQMVIFHSQSVAYVPKRFKSNFHPVPLVKCTCFMVNHGKSSQFFMIWISRGQAFEDSVGCWYADPGGPGPPSPWLPCHWDTTTSVATWGNQLYWLLRPAIEVDGMG